MTTLTHQQPAAADYQAALHGVALHDASHHGRIWLHNRDRASLLHRLSTNAIEGLAPGAGTRTVLANHHGRIIDLLTVHVLPEQLLLVSSPPQHQAVLRLFKKNIFFGDKVKVADATPDLGQLALYGPQSAALLAQVTGCSRQALENLALHYTLDITLPNVPDAPDLHGVHMLVARTLPIGGAGFLLYLPPAAQIAFWSVVQAAGALPLSAKAYDTLRVERGYPTYGRELSLDYIPLETGLWDAVSFQKGCYVGQEIIARMESRNRIAKKLRGLKLSEVVDLPESGPRKLQVNGKEAGDLTSIVDSPRFGPLALAYVRSAHAEPGTVVGIADSSATGEVVSLPLEPS